MENGFLSLARSSRLLPDLCGQMRAARIEAQEGMGAFRRGNRSGGANGRALHSPDHDLHDCILEKDAEFRVRLAETQRPT
jgi:hypothetical protein